MAIFSDVQEAAKDQSKLKLLAQGKTKEIHSIEGFPEVVLVRSKDQLTAFNAARKDDLKGKGAIANRTTTNVFTYLQNLGMKTHFVCEVSDNEFVAYNCAMIPIEWVVRRVATGSFLKRNPGVQQGYRFNVPKIETFFKDDANDDPQWSDDQIISAKFHFNGVQIAEPEIALMKRQTKIIFQTLEKGWELSQCALIDMKVEFGVTPAGEIVLADVIDNDSWRVWPKGDKRLQLDKQFYRDMKEVTQEALQQLIANYEKVAQLTAEFSGEPRTRALIIMGSASDGAFCEKIASRVKSFGISPVVRVSSAHKATPDTLNIVGEYEGDGVPTVVIAVAGRSNGLGPVIAGNSYLPVINAPPAGADWVAQDIWSSLHTPSGLGCCTVLGADEAALAAAKILAQKDHMVHGKVLCDQLNNYITIYKSDAKFNAKCK